MDQTFSPGDSGGTLQRKSRRRAALGSFPTQHESSLPFVPMISLEEVQLNAGTVKILIMNVQLITGGDLLFLMDVIWMNRKWFLLRQHDEFIRIQPCNANQPNQPNHTEVLAFYRAWLTECPNATALIQNALALKPDCPTIMESSTKNPLLADLKNRAQSYLNDVLAEASTTNTEEFKQFIDPSQKPSVWFLTMQSHMRGTFRVGTFKDQYCALYAGRVYVFKTMSTRAPSLVVDVTLSNSIELMYSPEGEPMSTFIILEDFKRKITFTCNLLSVAQDWVIALRKARDVLPCKETVQYAEIVAGAREEEEETDDEISRRASEHHFIYMTNSNNQSKKVSHYERAKIALQDPTISLDQQQMNTENKLPPRYLYLPDDYDSIRFKLTLSIGDLNRLSLGDSGVGDCDASSAILMATTYKLFQFLFKNKLDKEIFISTFCLWNPYQKGLLDGKTLSENSPFDNFNERCLFEIIKDWILCILNKAKGPPAPLSEEYALFLGALEFLYWWSSLWPYDFVLTAKEKEKANDDPDAIRTKFGILELLVYLKDKVPQDCMELFANIVENLQYPASLASKRFRAVYYNSQLDKFRERRREIQREESNGARDQQQSGARNDKSSTSYSSATGLKLLLGASSPSSSRTSGFGRKESGQEETARNRNLARESSGNGLEKEDGASVTRRSTPQSSASHVNSNEKSANGASSSGASSSGVKSPRPASSPTGFRSRSTILFGRSLDLKPEADKEKAESNENSKLLARTLSDVKASNETIYETSILPKLFGPDQFHIFDLSSMEVARQLCLATQALFRKVDTKEWILWNTKDKATPKCKNLRKLVENFNQLTAWASTYIVTGFYTKQRAYYMKHVISIAYYSLQLNNFHATMALLVSLRFPPIQRLKKSWRLVEQKYTSMFGEIQEVLDIENNWSKYRARLESSARPSLPYIGVFLQDLTFLNDGNQTFKPILLSQSPRGPLSPTAQPSSTSSANSSNVSPSKSGSTLAKRTSKKSPPFFITPSNSMTNTMSSTFATSTFAGSTFAGSTFSTSTLATSPNGMESTLNPAGDMSDTLASPRSEAIPIDNGAEMTGTYQPSLEPSGPCRIGTRASRYQQPQRPSERDRERAEREKAERDEKEQRRDSTSPSNALSLSPRSLSPVSPLSSPFNSPPHSPRMRSLSPQRVSHVLNPNGLSNSMSSLPSPTTSNNTHNSNTANATSLNTSSGSIPMGTSSPPVSPRVRSLSPQRMSQYVSTLPSNQATNSPPTSPRMRSLSPQRASVYNVTSPVNSNSLAEMHGEKQERRKSPHSLNINNSSAANEPSEPPPEIDVMMVNWEKCYKMSEVVRKINEYNHGRFPFRRIPEIHDYFNNAFANVLSEAEMRKISFAVEPKVT